MHNGSDMKADEYTQGFCVLLEWGRAHLFGDHDVDLDALVTRWENARPASAHFDNDLQILKNKIEYALKLVASPATVDIDEDDAQELQTCLDILDHVVFLSETLEFFPGSCDLPESFSETVESLLCRITNGQEIPFLRLIPMNAWRCERLSRIPESRHYLFPWYTQWSHMPEDFPDAWCFEFLPECSDERFHLPDSSLDDITQFRFELETDSDLLDRIRYDARMMNLVPEAVGEDMALKLYALRRSVQRQVLEETSVEDAVMAIPALWIMVDDNSSETDRIEKMLLGAFFGPVLDDRQRMDAFCRVQTGIERIETFSLEGNDLLKQLHLWSKGRLDDTQWVDFLTAQWNRRILDAVDRTGAVATYADAFKKLSEKEYRNKKETLSIGHKITSIFSGTKSGGSFFHESLTKKLAFAAVASVIVAFLTVFSVQKVFRSHSPVPVTGQLKISKKIRADIKEKQVRNEKIPDLSTFILIPEDKLESMSPLITNEWQETTSAPQSVSDAGNAPVVDRLKLKAIVLIPHKNRALLEDETGKGYIVSPGTRIGFYRVSQILKDRIVIEPDAASVSVDTRLQRRVLRLENANPQQAEIIDK